MIKIFGKGSLSLAARCSHPDNILVFIGHSDFCWTTLMYESSRVPTLVLFSFFLFMVLLGMGVHRYFTIYDDGTLRIITANPFTPIKVKISPILLKKVRDYQDVNYLIF